MPNSGQSIIEIVVALGIFAVVAAALVAMILGGEALVARSGEMARAQSYLEEGSEAVRSIKNRAWNEMVFNRSGLTFSDNKYDLTGEGTNDVDGIYSRSIDFFSVYRDVNDNIAASAVPGAYLDVLSKKVVVAVSWDIGKSTSSIISEVLYFTNWNALTWEQSEWSDGPGQAVWVNPARYSSSDGNLETNISGQISLEEVATSTYAENGFLYSSAFDTGHESNFSAIIWDEEIPAGCARCHIKVQIKTAPDANGTPGAWSASWSGPEGEDGDEDDFYTVATGEMIPLNENGKQWVKYKVMLAGDIVETPILKNLRIHYQ